MLDAILGQGGDLQWWQECARAALIFAYGLLIFRLAGRRIFGKWSALDVIVSLIVGSNLSRALTGNADLWGTLAATTLLIVLHGLVAQLVARSQVFSRLFEGRALPVLSAGETDRRRLRLHAISDADFLEALRARGIDNPAEARAVILEPSGKISVLRRR